MKQKKMDFGVLVFFIMLGLLSFWLLQMGSGQAGDRVVIRQAGKPVGSYSLRENRQIILQNSYGTNKIMIQDGVVYMEEASCRDQICVKHKPISRSKERIVCLPNKLMIQIIGLGDEEVDMLVD